MKMKGFVLMNVPKGELDQWIIHWMDHEGWLEPVLPSNWVGETCFKGSMSFALLCSYHGMLRTGLDLPFWLSIEGKLHRVEDLTVYKSETRSPSFVSSWTSDERGVHWDTVGGARLYTGERQDRFPRVAKPMSWLDCAKAHLSRSELQKSLAEFLTPAW